MELKLMYRVLRALSECALDFYSEVHVEGQHNVPADGPLLVVSCHHNEILDIATLAVTIPHRRPLSFWAKSSLFKNPLARAILVSSGSIPVRRNPNNASSANCDYHGGDEGGGRQALFRETFSALDAGAGGAVGVFPEGTSYTEPRIAQVKEGAAWAALEYLRWKEGRGEAGRLLIVPVGIVHTAKTRYRSRMLVRWGAPIDIASFTREHGSQTDDEVKAVVKKLTEEIEGRIVKLTINAPDWDTLHVARIARDMLWSEERNIAMRDFPDVSQSLIELLSASDPPPSLFLARTALLRYYSLLHYGNISHAHLTALLPNLRQPSIPTRVVATSLALRQLLATVLHPRFLVFLPPLLAHIPAYALAGLAKRTLASPREEETHAEFKAIFGMIGAGATYAVLGGVLARVADRLPILDTVHMVITQSHGIPRAALEVVERLGGWLGSYGGIWRDKLVLMGCMYVTAKVLSKWHNGLVGANLIQAQRLVTALKLARGICASPSSDLTPNDLELYCTPPEPFSNPFIKRRGPAEAAPKPAAQRKTCPAQVPPSWKFIRPLLEARTEASYALADYLADVEMRDVPQGPTGLRRLRQLGACF